MALKKNSQSGVTLIELVIALVIISVALTAMAFAVSSMAKRSADPAIRQQAIAIASAYMAEITQKEFPDVNSFENTCNFSQTKPPNIARSDYTNICHYNELKDVGAVDQNGAAIVGLEGYTVQVFVLPMPSLGKTGLYVLKKDALAITVKVTNPAANTSFSLVSYRARYGGS